MYNIYAQTDDKDDYSNKIKNNENFELKSGNSLSQEQLSGYSGTVHLSSGSYAEMPNDFGGILVLTEATVKMPNGKIVKGTGRCDKEGCTIIQGETGEGQNKISNGQFYVKNSGEIDIPTTVTVGESDSAVTLSNVKNLRFNQDGTFTFNVQEDSEVGSVIIGSQGSATFNPNDYSLKLTTSNPNFDDIFIIKSLDYTKKPITIVRDNVDVQLDKGMFLIKGYVKPVFKEVDCTGNCIVLGSNFLRMKGEDYTIRFNEQNSIVSVNPSQKSGSSLEVSPKKTGVVEILNRNTYNTDGTIDLKKSQAPKISITGESSQEVWAELKDDGIKLEAGINGILNYRINRRGGSEPIIPVELNVVDSNGRSLIRDTNGREIKATINDYTSILEFSTIDAKVDVRGEPYCLSSSSITGGAISEITGKGVVAQKLGCDGNLFEFRRIFGTKAAIDTARDEFNRNLERPHDFNPEYAQTLDSITLYYTGKEAAGTQIEILKALPQYTKIKLFIGNDEQREYLQEVLPPDVFSRITFLKAPKGQDFSVWAQDYTEGDNKVQILPLTYLGGGSRKTPLMPENEFIFELEKTGVEIRRVPVEFAGGNIFIAVDGNGKKILLNGADDFIYTSETYKELGKPISEQEYRDILKKAFNVDDVVMIGRRDEGGALLRQEPLMFHIDQSMIPISDGLVAMPRIELPQSYPAQEEIYNEWKNSVMNLAKKYLIEVEIVEGKAVYKVPDSWGIRQENELHYQQRKIDWKYSEAMKIYFIKEEMEAYRDTMRERGFQIIDLLVTQSNLNNFQAYTNGIVYMDKETGQKSIIMPIFPNEQGEYKMEGTNLKNKEAFEKAGFNVKVVPDKAFKYHGNIHCLTILASNTQHPPNTCPLQGLTA